MIVKIEFNVPIIMPIKHYKLSWMSTIVNTITLQCEHINTNKYSDSPYTFIEFDDGIEFRADNIKRIEVL